MCWFGQLILSKIIKIVAKATMHQCRAPKIQLGFWGSAVGSPSGDWSRAPQSIKKIKPFKPAFTLWSRNTDI